MNKIIKQSIYPKTTRFGKENTGNTGKRMFNSLIILINIYIR